MGTFVRRLVALTVVWLFATTALTYAAARRMGTTPAKPAATTTAAPAAVQTLVVPDVRRQAYVFAEGTLGDAGFGWRVEGAVHGFAANLVASQSPAPGTRVVDTGHPTIVLRLSRPSGAKESGLPADRSPVAGTPIRLADLTLGSAPAAVTPAVVKTPAAKPKAAAKPAVKKPAAKTKARWPQHRPPAFTVPGGRSEPLDEMPLTDRADLLLTFVRQRPKPTDANVRHWLFQHAWVVAGARLGWWHGATALQTLLEVDRQVWDLWGIGARSEQVARTTLAEVEARSR